MRALLWSKNRPPIPYASRAKRWSSPLDSASNVSGQTREWSASQVLFKGLAMTPTSSWEFAATVTPQQMGVPERAERTIVTIARCLLKDVNFPRSLCVEMFFAHLQKGRRTLHYTA